MGLDILISNKIDFKLKLIKRDKKDISYLSPKILQYEVSILNISASNTGICTFVKEITKAYITHQIPNTNNGRLQCPSLTSGEVSQTET